MQKLIEMMRVPEVRKRVAVTLGAILVFRVGCQLAAPGVDGHKMAELVSAHAGPLVGFLNLFSGGALERFSVFALGLQPYINASIVLQLLTHVVPSLERLRKDDGKEGQETLKRWTRYGAVSIALVQAFGVCVLVEGLDRGRAPGLLTDHGAHFRLVAVLTLTAGAAFLMWLSERVTEHGVGNGASVLITVGIVARLPSAVAVAAQAFEVDRLAPAGCVKLTLLAAASLALVALVVLVQDAVRKVPVQHARRIERCTARAATSSIPLKITQGGVMPVIFASSVMALAATLVPRLRESAHVYLGAEFVLIVAFAFFYAALELDPRELAQRLRREGAFTPGVRAGAATARYLDRVLARVTLAGGVFLGLVALAPHALSGLFGGGLEAVGIGGTSLLIVVGVLSDAVRQVEAHALTRQYHRVLRR